MSADLRTGRKAVLFIAMSLDGYIADKDGGVDWLSGQDEAAETEDVYSVFIKDVDTVIMGWNTYRQVTTELSPGEWIYSNLRSYVVTHRNIPSAEEIIFTQENPCALAERLKKEEGKNIWICGGADIIRQLMEEDLIDTYYISVIPVVLGAGIRLFGTLERGIRLRLVRTHTYNGITDLVYEREKGGKS